MPAFRSASPLSVARSAVALLVLAACGDAADPTGDAGGAATLSVSVAAASADTNRAGNIVVVGTANDTLVLTRVQLVLDEVKLKRAGVSSCPDSMVVSSDSRRSSDDRGCSRLDLGPTLVDLPLGGAAKSALAVTVPAGVYREFEFELDDVRTGANASQADRDFLTAHPEFRDVTVRVTGTLRGTAFTFLSRASAEIEFEFEPALTVQSGVNDNVSVEMDIAAWFKDARGALLTPTVVNQTRIDQNIIQSFSAFGDRDRDGRADSGRGRGRGRGRGGDD
jgi:hypothetical protein